jgi:hypothetical protein
MKKKRLTSMVNEMQLTAKESYKDQVTIHEDEKKEHHYSDIISDARKCILDAREPGLSGSQHRTIHKKEKNNKCTINIAAKSCEVEASWYTKLDKYTLHGMECEPPVKDEHFGLVQFTFRLSTVDVYSYDFKMKIPYEENTANHKCKLIYTEVGGYTNDELIADQIGKLIAEPIRMSSYQESVQKYLDENLDKKKAGLDNDNYQIQANKILNDVYTEKKVPWEKHYDEAYVPQFKDFKSDVLKDKDIKCESYVWCLGKNTEELYDKDVYAAYS